MTEDISPIGVTDIKITKGNWCNGEYKYNVQFLHYGCYSGNGKFVKTYKEAIDYIVNILKEA